MIIPTSALHPFGYTGIPVMAVTEPPDIIELFGFEFLKYAKLVIANSYNMEDAAGALYLQRFLRSGAMRHAKAYARGVSNISISRTYDNKFYLEYDVVGVHQYQLMLDKS